MIIAYRSWLLGIRSGMLYSTAAPNKQAAAERYCWESATATAVCNSAYAGDAIRKVVQGVALRDCRHAEGRRLGSRCGIYAYTKPQGGYYTHIPGACVVTGVVGLWGEVHRHQLGYRAEHARIIAVVDHPRIKVQAYPMVRRYPSVQALLVDWGQE